jgi:uncharacterized protein (DUF488 family)
VEICTIGTAKRSAESFFGALNAAEVDLLADTRLRATSQLAGFTQARDLEYFVPRLTRANYRALPELAPTKAILDNYKRGLIDWPAYERAYLALLQERDAGSGLAWLREDGPSRVALLCSEQTADRCHRRLAADYLAAAWGDVSVRHL